MVVIKVKLQKRPGNRGKYDTFVVTLPKQILDKIPNSKNAKEVEMDINSKNIITIKLI